MDSRFALLFLLVLLPWVKASETHEAASEEVTAASVESSVLVLDGSNFTQAIESHPFIVVEFYAPWCGHCKRLAPEYEQAAVELKNHVPPIILAKVDANEETNKPLAVKYDVKGFPSLKIFKNGGDGVIEYKGPREAAGIVTYLKSLTGPASLLLTSSEQVSTFIVQKELTVVGVFESLDSTEFANFLSVAEELRSDYQFTHTLETSYMPENSAPISAPAVRLYKPFDEKFNDATDFSVEVLKAFLEEKSSPLVTELTKDPSPGIFLTKFFNSNATKVFSFLDLKAEGVDAYRNAYTELAKSVQDKGIKFLIVDAVEHENALKFYGINADGLPAIVVQVDDREKFLGLNVEAAQLAPWLQDVLDGKLERHVKSEEIPATNDEPVKVVVRKSLQEMVLDSGKTVLLEFYAPECGHCKKLAPTLDEVATTFEANSDVLIAKFDVTANDLPEGLFEVVGFPTLYAYTSSGISVPYAGDRSKEDLIEFVNKHRDTSITTGVASDTAKDEL